MVMHLFLVEDPNGGSYDTFDSFVVAAPSADKAKLYNPKGKIYPCKDWHYWGAWADTPNSINVTFIGVAAPSCKEGEIICSSFNAA